METNTLMNRRIDELTSDDISALKREPRKRYRNIVNRICRIDDRAYANRGRCELGASEIIIDKIKKGDMNYLQNINNVLMKANGIVKITLKDDSLDLSSEDRKVINRDMFTANCFLTSLNTICNGNFVENPNINLEDITYKVGDIRNASKEEVFNLVEGAFEEINNSKLLSLVKGVSILIKDRNLEELRRRTDILEEYLNKIGVHEEVFSHTFRHLDKDEYFSNSNKRMLYEIDLTHLIYCTQFMLIATHPSYDRVLRNRNEKSVSKISW